MRTGKIAAFLVLSGVKEPVAAMSECIDTQNDQSNPDQREANPPLQGHGFAHDGHPERELHHRG
jgi:hypothetical protein